MMSHAPARTLLRVAPLAIALALAAPHAALALDSASAPTTASTSTPAHAPAPADLATPDASATPVDAATPADAPDPDAQAKDAALPADHTADPTAKPSPASPSEGDAAAEKSALPPATLDVAPTRTDPMQPAPAAQPEPAAKAEVAEAVQATYSNMYRLYNPWTGEHLYTASLVEARSVAEIGWQWESVGWVAPDSGDPVYRLYNPYSGDHHYTLSAVERDRLTSIGWRYEGVGWYSDVTSASVALLRQFNPYETVGTHNYTTNGAEDAFLASIGWVSEGEAWRASSHAQLRIDGFWLVTSAWGSLQRYWVGSDALLAHDRLVDPSEGSGYYAYATGSGAVVRGALDRGDGWAWLADNDGRLASGDGWLITDAFGQGTQRYYLGAHGGWSLARVGEFVVDGLRYFGRGEYGFELRNDAVWLGSWLWANNDGVLSGASALLSTLLDAAHWTPAAPAGWCAAWVENVVANAGLGDFMGNACDLYDWYCASGSLSDIRPGMIVAVSSHPHTEAGSIYGHVGIYVGNGSIRDSVYGYVREMRLSEWVAYYGASVQPRWGWLGGVAAC